MEVAIAGAHGKIGMLLGGLLVEQGHTVLGLIRNPDQEEDLHAIGVEPVLCDLEGDDDVGEAVGGVDAVVFAAGAGPGSSAERKRTMDLGGAVRLIEAAKAEGIRRYLIVSSMGTGDPPAEGGDVFGEYLRGKAGADRALEASGLDFTIVRPGGLTGEPPTGLVEVGSGLDRGEIPRADVAAVLAAALTSEEAIGKTFELISGDTPIADALASL
ncbi:MAG: SDR family oxidoreductase [Solirubrobacterales bacterium]|nr:SDR family oxidoreductase [Solirubrobacterales bacterium]